MSYRDMISYLFLGDFQKKFPKANIVLHDAWTLEAWAGCGPGMGKATYTMHIYPSHTLYQHPELKLVPLDAPHDCDDACCGPK